MRFFNIVKKVISLLRFRWFERKIDRKTLRLHNDLIHWARDCGERAGAYESAALYENSTDPIVKKGFKLTNRVKEEFSGKHRHLNYLRVLVHVPTAMRSPGGHSLFNNLVSSLAFIGIPCRCLEWDEGIGMALETFKPGVFITSDNSEYLKKIDWNLLRDYRSSHPLILGLTASLEEYGNTPLRDRLTWARSHDVKFYYSFRSPQYLRERKEYLPYFDSGYDIFSIEFGANPLLYYPVPGFDRDLDYVFLASSNYEKRARYYEYLTGIFSNHLGLIDGPGWSFSRDFSFDAARDRYLYARAKVGINLSIEGQIRWSSELNERTYMLAACGVPQLIDAPKLLSSRFSGNCMYVAQSPDEYYASFKEILSHPEGAQIRALNALDEVFAKHTTFHRAEKFAMDLSTVYSE